MSSFSLGMLHERKLEAQKYQLQIIHNTDINQAWTDYHRQKGIGNYFASKSGTKIYSVNCKAGNRVKESNKVFFQTRAHAEALGYTMSNQC